MSDVPAELDIEHEGREGYDASGLPRSLRMELRSQNSRSSFGRESALWLSGRAAIETLNFGAFSLDASARLRERLSSETAAGSAQLDTGAGASFTLNQLAMPFAGGWFASQGAGVISSISPALPNTQSSFYLPSRLIQGLSTVWSNEALGLKLMASTGETGAFAAGGLGAFRGTGNRVTAVGLQAQTTSLERGELQEGEAFAYSIAASTSSGADVLGIGTDGSRPGWLGASEARGTSLAQSVRWTSPGLMLQGSALYSGMTDKGLFSRGAGAWVDAAHDRGPLVQRWGAHYLTRALNWQGAPLGANSQGGYYRWSYFGLRDQLEAQVSASEPVARDGANNGTRQAAVLARRRQSQSLAYGGVIQLLGRGQYSTQLSGFLESRHKWLDLRSQLALEVRDAAVVHRRLASDQSWATPLGQRLSTSIALASGAAASVGGPGSGDTVELGLVAGLDIRQDSRIDLDLRAIHALRGEAAAGYSLTASGQHKLSQGWTLAVSASVARATAPAAAPAPSPIPQLPSGFAASSFTVDSRNVFVSLRYDFDAGLAQAPIGGRPGSGSGSIVGVVYLDANANGVLDALEARAPDVVVTLDGKFATRTDGQGRYEFASVAPGPHVVSVVPDNLPLPWSMPPSAARLKIEVIPRGVSRVELGAFRDRAVE